MIRVIVIDDEPLACHLVKEYLAEYPQFEVVATCHDGFDGAKAITEHKPDLIFLDVQMPKINGFELLELLDEKPAVIFTTAFDAYAVQAFEASATDYLLKPYTKERFDRAIQKYLEKPAQNIDRLIQNQKITRIVIRDGGRIRILPLKDVWVIEADDDYVKIKTADGAFLKKDTLKHYEEELPYDQFVRVHRTFMVNVSQISRIDPYEKTSHVAVLKNGDRIAVSKQGYLRLKEVLGI